MLRAIGRMCSSWIWQMCWRTRNSPMKSKSRSKSQKVPKFSPTFRLFHLTPRRCSRVIMHCRRVTTKATARRARLTLPWTKTSITLRCTTTEVKIIQAGASRVTATTVLLTSLAKERCFQGGRNQRLPIKTHTKRRKPWRGFPSWQTKPDSKTCSWSSTISFEAD